MVIYGAFRLDYGLACSDVNFLSTCETIASGLPFFVIFMSMRKSINLASGWKQNWTLLMRTFIVGIVFLLRSSYFFVYYDVNSILVFLAVYVERHVVFHQL